MVCRARPVLSRWKIADNLRRSLAPAALLSLFLLGWCSDLDSGLWTLALLVLALSPALLHGLLALPHKPAGWVKGFKWSSLGCSTNWKLTCIQSRGYCC